MMSSDRHCASSAHAHRRAVPEGADGKPRSSTERLRELISTKLKAAGRSHRWTERRLKLGHRTVTNVLAGRTALRFEHLDLFAELFETTPARLLAEAEGDDTPNAQRKLRLVLQLLNAALQAAEGVAASTEPST